MYDHIYTLLYNHIYVIIRVCNCMYVCIYIYDSRTVWLWDVVGSGCCAQVKDNAEHVRPREGFGGSRHMGLDVARFQDWNLLDFARCAKDKTLRVQHGVTV